MTKKAATSAGKKRAATSAGKKRAAASADKKRAGASADKKRAAASASKKRAATSTGKKRAATSAGKKRAATSAGKKRAGARASKTARAKASDAPHIATSVAVLESARSHRVRARDSVSALGYTLLPDGDEAALRAQIVGESPPEVVLVGWPGGEQIIQACRARRRNRPVVIVALAGPAPTATTRCNEAGADLFALRPHSKDSLAGVLQAALALAREHKQVAALEATEDILRARLRRYGEADATTGLQHFDFFKQLLVMEMKRAKRFGYSLAACLVVFDPWDVDRPEPPFDAVSKLRTRVASAMVSCIRDIDLPVDFGEDRFLAFLPYTDLAGAEQVGRRIAASVKSFGGLRVGDHTYSMSVSVGISALRPGKPVSFARIMRDASAAVRAAQLKGGGRVVVRK